MIRFSKVLLAPLFLIFVLSCQSRQDEALQLAQKGILLFGNGAEPQDLDPHIVTGVPEANILRALFEGLIREDPRDLKPIPGIAESWEVSQDQKTYRFQLRKNAKWSNGDPVTAEDFVISWKRALAPKLGGEYSYMLYVVKNAEAYNKGKIQDFRKVGVKALNAHLLEVTLKSPTPYFLSLLQHYSTWPIHAKTLQKFGALDLRGTRWTRPENMVSNGPFVLKKWAMNEIIEVEASPHYWDRKKVKLKGIHFLPTESQQTEERQFRSGKLHVTDGVPLNKIEVYQKDNPDLIHFDPYLGVYFYAFNVKNPPFDQKKVRQALSMAVDREALVKHILKGGRIAAYHFTPPNTSGYTARARLSYNPEKAKVLLKEAGFGEKKKFPEVEILFNTHEAHRVIAEAIQQMWKTKLGIEVTLRNQEWKVIQPIQRQVTYKSVIRAAWIGDYIDPNSFLDLFVTEGTNNYADWSHPEYDRLIQKASVTPEVQDRMELFQKAEAILLEEAPVIPIYFYTRIYLKVPYLKGWYPNLLDHHPFTDAYFEF